METSRILYTTAVIGFTFNENWKKFAVDKPACLKHHLLAQLRAPNAVYIHRAIANPDYSDVLFRTSCIKALFPGAKKLMLVGFKHEYYEPLVEWFQNQYAVATYGDSLVRFVSTWIVAACYRRQIGCCFGLWVVLRPVGKRWRVSPSMANFTPPRQLDPWEVVET